MAPHPEQMTVTARPAGGDGGAGHEAVSDDTGDTGDALKVVKVVAAVIERDGRIFVTQRGYGEFKDQWEFPGGKIEPGESPEDALRRELREELRLEIEVGELIDTVEYDYPGFHLTMLVYRCTMRGGQPVLLEHEAARWLPREELPALPWLPADRGLLSRI